MVGLGWTLGDCLWKKGDESVEGVGMKWPSIQITIIWGWGGTGGTGRIPIQTGLANQQKMPCSNASIDTRGAWSWVSPHSNSTSQPSAHPFVSNSQRYLKSNILTTSATNTRLEPPFFFIWISKYLLTGFPASAFATHTFQSQPSSQSNPVKT